MLKKICTTNCKESHLAYSHFLAGAGGSLEAMQKSLRPHMNISPACGNVPPNELPALLATSLERRQPARPDIGQQSLNEPTRQSHTRGQGSRKSQQKAPPIPCPMSSSSDSSAPLAPLFLPSLPSQIPETLCLGRRRRAAG